MFYLNHLSDLGDLKNYRWYDDFSNSYNVRPTIRKKAWNVKKKKKNGDQTPIGSWKMEAHSNQPARILPKTVPSIL